MDHRLTNNAKRLKGHICKQAENMDYINVIIMYVCVCPVCTYMGFFGYKMYQDRLQMHLQMPTSVLCPNVALASLSPWGIPLLIPLLTIVSIQHMAGIRVEWSGRGRLVYFTTDQPPACQVVVALVKRMMTAGRSRTFRYTRNSRWGCFSLFKHTGLPLVVSVSCCQWLNTNDSPVWQSASPHSYTATHSQIIGRGCVLSLA